MDIKGALTRPLGPLPAWAWGVVVAGGYLLYRYLHTGSLFGGSSSTAATTTPVVVPASDYGGGSTGTTGTTTSTTSTTATTAANNVTTAVSNAISGTPAPGNGLFYTDVPGQVVDRANSITGNVLTNTRWDVPASQLGSLFTNAQTVGPLTYPAGLTTEQVAIANSQNVSLTDWYRYQLAQNPNFTGTMYGVTANNAPQQALDAEARAAALAGPNANAVTTSNQNVPATTLNIPAGTPILVH